MLRISKVLWGVGLLAVGSSLLLYSQQEAPSRNSLSLAEGVAKEVSVGRGSYKIYLEGHKKAFIFTNLGFCENLNRLEQGSNLTLLYKSTNQRSSVLEILRDGMPVCSLNASMTGEERERSFSLKAGIPMVLASVLFFIGALFTRNLTSQSSGPAKAGR